MGKINILYQSDDTYAAFLGVSLTSLLVNNRECEEIDIYILNIGISGSNLEKLRQTCLDFGRKIVVIDCKALECELYGKGIEKYRGSYATYLKLYVEKYLPEEVDKILYIDCDTVINGKLEKLFAFNLGNAPLGMVPDILAYQHKRKIGFGKDEDYFNAGVILFHMENWKTQEWGCRLNRFLAGEDALSLHKHDQDIINVVFRGHIARLPDRYNMQSICFSADMNAVYKVYSDVIHVSKERLLEEKKNSVILHFMVFLGESPWNSNCKHPFGNIFMDYKKKSLWYDMDPIKARLGIFYRIEKMLYQKIPDYWFLRLFRMVHDLFCLI